jgi:acetylornithine/succinyldiaminopimelate/putrescine aminotransferase
MLDPDASVNSIGTCHIDMVEQYAARNYAPLPIVIAHAEGVCGKRMAEGVLCKDTHEQTMRIAPLLSISREKLTGRWKDYSRHWFKEHFHEFTLD